MTWWRSLKPICEDILKVAWPDPSLLSAFTNQLTILGEVHFGEMAQTVHVWLPLLSAAGWIAPVSDIGYHATEKYFQFVSERTETERSRYICFAIADYRHYLISILAEGLVKAGQIDYHVELEDWLLNHDLASLANEINALLDEIEGDRGRMVEWPSEQVTEAFAAWHRQHSPFGAWDQMLLGLSHSPEHLFSPVLKHVKVLSAVAQECEPAQGLVALLPDFDVVKDGADRLQFPVPSSWYTARKSVVSSLPFYDEHGQPLYDPNQSPLVTWQDMLAQQPYYRAVLRVAIAVRHSHYDSEKIRVMIDTDLANAQMVVANSDRGSLESLLPPLVEILGYRAGTHLSRERVARILENWIAVDVLEAAQGEIRLREDYGRTLAERRRGQVLLRGDGQREQERVKRFLKGAT
jgi:hypothetical protein